MAVSQIWDLQQALCIILEFWEIKQQYCMDKIQKESGDLDASDSKS